jgi:lipopolysaccharide export system permease protein
MRRHDRLVRATLWETVPYVLLTFVILTTLVFVQQVGRYSEIVFSFESTGEVVWTFIMTLLPGIVVITLPVGLVLGTVMTCSRQSADLELTSAQASGIGQVWLGLPFLILGGIGTGLGLYLTTEVAPQSLREMRSLRSRISLEEAKRLVRPHVFTTSFPNSILYVQELEEQTGAWRGVFLVQKDPMTGVDRVVTAERGQFRSPERSGGRGTRGVVGGIAGVEVDLYRGVTIETGRSVGPGGAGETEEESAAEFEQASIRLQDPRGGRATEGPGLFAELTMGELSRRARLADSETDRRAARVEWHRRLAFPFASLFLPGAAFALSVAGRRRNTRPRTVVAILFVALGYYLLLVMGQNLASRGAVPAWFGVWASNLLFGGYLLGGERIRRVLASLLRRRLQSSDEQRQDPLERPRWRGEVRARLDPERWWSLGRRVLAFRLPFRAPWRFPSLLSLINYLLVSEVAKYYLLALVALVVTSTTFTLFDLIPALAKSGLSAKYAAGYLGYLAPQLAYYVSPFAVLVAILIGGSVLARTNQFVVLSASGLGRSRIILAVLTTTILLGVGLWVLSNHLLPYTNREQDLRYHQIKNKQLEQTTIAFGRKWVFGQNQTIYSYQRIEEDHTLLDAEIYRLSPDRRILTERLQFREAEQTGTQTWRILDGETRRIRPDLTIDHLPIDGTAARLTIVDGVDLFKRTVNQSTKMSAHDLRLYLEQLSRIGIKSREMELDLQKRIAFPFSCVTLGLLAIPFATTRRARRSSPLTSVAIGVAISLVLWLLMSVFEAAGKQGSLPVLVAVWAPQVLFLAIAILLNTREGKI